MGVGAYAAGALAASCTGRFWLTIPIAGPQRGGCSARSSGSRRCASRASTWRSRRSPRSSSSRSRCSSCPSVVRAIGGPAPGSGRAGLVHVRHRQPRLLPGARDRGADDLRGLGPDAQPHRPRVSGARQRDRGRGHRRERLLLQDARSSSALSTRGSPVRFGRTTCATSRPTSSRWPSVCISHADRRRMGRSWARSSHRRDPPDAGSHHRCGADGRRRAAGAGRAVRVRRDEHAAGRADHRLRDLRAAGLVHRWNIVKESYRIWPFPH